LLRQPLPERGKAGKLEQFFTTCLAVVHFVDLGKELDVLIDGEITVKAEALGEISDLSLDCF